ncbi:hypothetical protein I4F81_008916 [Pyropia yezoensis]|uniref:Uncharacterized protein n=1 Tax=Pyropia yezoensis TaxID=2788 RepID=A0ACC3C8U1_PYRYE|nr:hypothetical protein I4F81_008916 [Neopyropia yezoensis]
MLRVNLYFSTARGVGAAVPPALTALLATRTAGQSATGASDPVVASAALTSPSASGGAGTLARPPPPPLSFLDGDAAGTTVLNVFDDAAYHRTNVSLAGADAGALAAAATGLIGAVAPRLSLVGHSGTHPRVGVVDHVSVQPMKGGGGGAGGGGAVPPLAAGAGAGDSPAAHGGPAGMAAARRLAMAIGRALGADVGLYVLLYGMTPPGGGGCGGGSGGGGGSARSLASLRRSVGYFTPTHPGGGPRGAAPLWAGPLPSPPHGGGFPAADFGPPVVDPAVGVVAVGASLPVRNVNVVLSAVVARLPGGQRPEDGGPVLLTAARALAAAVRGAGRGGDTAMAGVEAMGLATVGGGAEVACNVGADADAAALVAALTRLAPTRGVAVVHAYDPGDGGRHVEGEARR